jgi:hypothetical protein
MYIILYKSTLIVQIVNTIFDSKMFKTIVYTFENKMRKFKKKYKNHLYYKINLGIKTIRLIFARLSKMIF